MGCPWLVYSDRRVAKLIEDVKGSRSRSRKDIWSSSSSTAFNDTPGVIFLIVLVSERDAVSELHDLCRLSEVLSTNRPTNQPTCSRIKRNDCRSPFSVGFTWSLRRRCKSVSNRVWKGRKAADRPVLRGLLRGFLLRRLESSQQTFSDKNCLIVISAWRSIMFRDRRLGRYFYIDTTRLLYDCLWLLRHPLFALVEQPCIRYRLHPATYWTLYLDVAPEVLCVRSLRSLDAGVRCDGTTSGISRR